MDSQDAFTTDTTGLPEASSPSVVRLRHGDSFDLDIRPVRKRIGDAEVRMLGYNGSIPGPTLHVDQGSQITVGVRNDGDVDATVHWHGLRLENRYDGVPEETQAPIAPGGAFSVAGDAAAVAASSSFEELRTDPELSAERELIARDFEREPDKVLSILASMPLLYGEEVQASSYVCPMHPEVTGSEPSTCPKCGMRLVPSDALPAAGSHESDAHDHHAHEEDHARGGHEHGDHGDGLEWEDLMPEINRASDAHNMLWKLVDPENGAENHRISWRFTVGDRVKIRLVNEMDSDHPMHHPFHIHGAGRFLILSRDGQIESNLVWKDTVLLRAGETADILLYVTNPGMWMAHCHIAEHTEGGMMFSFDVAPSPEGRSL